MKSFNESEIKYLAGLLDADGCFHLKIVDGKYVAGELSLSASESIDKKGYIHSLGERAGYVTTTHYPDSNWSTSHKWRVCKRTELNMLMPRLLKHMVIKAKHWKFLFDILVSHRGAQPEDFVKSLPEIQTESRRTNVGPLKPKNHPTWAWVAGYLDGDGWYTFKKHPNKEAKNCMTLRVGAVCHESDVIGIELLFKAFGGQVRVDEKGYYRWNRNLGVKDSSFAIRFLKKVHRHSRLKIWKIERMLEFHNNRLQRLSEPTSTEEAIV